MRGGRVPLLAFFAVGGNYSFPRSAWERTSKPLCGVSEGCDAERRDTEFPRGALGTSNTQTKLRNKKPPAEPGAGVRCMKHAECSMRQLALRELRATAGTAET